MSCVSSSNLSHWLTWRPCRKAGGGGAGKACVVAQLHERGKLRRYRLTRGKERVGGVMGWGEQGVSSVKANCSPIEWNDSEELVEVGSFVCKRLKHLSDRVEIPPVFLLRSVCFYSYSDPVSPEQSLSSLSLSLFTSLHLSISQSISPSVSVQ